MKVKTHTWMYFVFKSPRDGQYYPHGNSICRSSVLSSVSSLSPSFIASPVVPHCGNWTCGCVGLTHFLLQSLLDVPGGSWQSNGWYQSSHYPCHSFQLHCTGKRYIRVFQGVGSWVKSEVDLDERILVSGFGTNIFWEKSTSLLIILYIVHQSVGRRSIYVGMASVKSHVIRAQNSGENG